MNGSAAALGLRCRSMPSPSAGQDGGMNTEAPMRSGVRSFPSAASSFLLTFSTSVSGPGGDFHIRERHGAATALQSHDTGNAAEEELGHHQVVDVWQLAVNEVPVARLLQGYVQQRARHDQRAVHHVDEWRLWLLLLLLRLLLLDRCRLIGLGTRKKVESAEQLARLGVVLLVVKGDPLGVHLVHDELKDGAHVELRHVPRGAAQDAHAFQDEVRNLPRVVHNRDLSGRHQCPNHAALVVALHDVVLVAANVDEQKVLCRVVSRVGGKHVKHRLPGVVVPSQPVFRHHLLDHLGLVLAAGKVHLLSGARQHLVPQQEVAEVPEPLSAAELIHRRVVVQRLATRQRMTKRKGSGNGLYLGALNAVDEVVDRDVNLLDEHTNRDLNDALRQLDGPETRSSESKEKKKTILPSPRSQRALCLLQHHCAPAFRAQRRT